MKIRRKDNHKQEPQDTKMPLVIQDEEEFTDITASAPVKNDTDKPKKLEEIYSTHEKQVKYKRLTPIEAEQEAKRMELAKQKLTSGKGEISLETPKDGQADIQLVTEYEEGTVIANDIITDVEELESGNGVHVVDIDDIDIDLDANSALKKYERQANSRNRYDERHKTVVNTDFERMLYRQKQYSDSDKRVTKIPVYRHDSKINMIHLKAGRFTDVVEREYDEYLKSNDPTISKRHAHIADKIDQKQSLLYTLSQMAQQRQALSQKSEKSSDTNKSDNTNSRQQDKKHGSKFKKFFRILGAILLSGFVSRKPNADYHDHSGSTIDYQSRQDYKQVMLDIRKNIRKLTTRVVVLSMLFATAFVFGIMEKISGKSILSGTEFSSLIYTAVNLVVLIVAGVTSKAVILNGLRPLSSLKGNSDTAVAVAFVVSMLQTVVAMFCSDMFVGDVLHLYVPVVVLGLLLNTVGRLVMATRVKNNFKFFSSKSPTYAAKIFKDEDTARKMLSGTAASRSVVAYQHPTDFLSDFLKISYAPDPSEDIAGKLAPITVICALFVGVVYAIVFKSFQGAVSALSVMCCIGIPVCSLLAGNIPLSVFCKNTLKNGAMLSGYPSVRQFCDSSALMVDASQLYPKTSVKLNKIISHSELRFDDNMLYAAVVLKEAGSPLYSVFEKNITENAHNLPQVESVMYEDKLGLVGWIAGERVLIGNKRLLDRYHIMMRDAADESRYKKDGKAVTYIACSGQLIATVITTYKPDARIKRWLNNAEENGLCIVVSTTDNNITADKIADDYHIFYRTVKVLSTGYANTCSEVCTQKEETSRAYLATRGNVASLMCAVSGCVRLKSNLIIGMIVQIFGLILGVLLCATIALYASVAMLGSVEILLYILFWGVATIAAELIVKP